MATIDLGKIKQVWRGTYNNSTAYTVDDLVAYTDTVGGLQNTSTYIAVANTTGNAPASGGSIHASWNLVAQGVPDRLPNQSGNSGKALITDGTNASWGTAGKVLQVVQEHDSSFTRLQTNSTTFTATTFKVGITPTAANSKILVDMRFISNNNGIGFDLYMTIRRSVAGGTFVDDFIPQGSTSNSNGNRYLTRNYGTNSRNEISTSMMILDTPSYTLGQTLEYKMYARSGSSAQYIEIPSSNNRTPVLCFATELAA